MNGKRLYRSTTDRQLAGVSAGLADYFNIDVTLVRLGFVLLTLMGGPGFLIYVVLWVVMPEGEPDDDYVYFDEELDNYPIEQDYSDDMVDMPNITTADPTDDDRY
ncbi:MAG: PspC domain-containing protein [Anaerolineae bacterium]|nr:PspC domain-containing protein [Anaerolineae bacterium]